MTTKDDCLFFKNKQQSFVNGNSQNADNNNLNLNQNQKCQVLIPIQSYSEKYKDKQCGTAATFQLPDAIVSDKHERNSQPSNKSSFTCLPNSFTHNDKSEEGTKKHWNNDSSPIHTTNSTLSLHISAYEAEAAESDSFSGESKTSKFVQQCEKSNENFNASKFIFQNPFEFPRQQSDKVPEPEISQFRASQRLLNSSQANESGNRKELKATTIMTPKKAPPLVYHSNQIKSLNGVDDMQEKYLYNAAIKMEEQIEYFISPNIERLNGILHELKKAEHGDKQTANLIVEMFSQLVEGSILQDKKMNKKINVGRNLQVYNTFADSTKLVQTYHNAFTNAQKVLGEYLLDYDLLILLCTKIAYSIFRQCKDSSGIKLPRLSNSPSSSHDIAISLNDVDLQLALNSILDYCLSLRTTRESFNKIFIEKLESRRLKLCDSNMKIVLHHRKKHLKSAKAQLSEIKSSSHDDSIELYKLASTVKKADKFQPVRVPSAEISNMQERIKTGRVLCDKKRSDIETCLLTNKESIIKNSELEFFEKENLRRDAVLKSELYKSQLSLLPKLELEKLYWRGSLARQLQQLKCSVFSAYLKNSEFRRKMIAIIQQFPQCLQQGRLAVENAVAKNNDLVGLIARKKATRFQSTQKCRNQWSQHYDVIDIALNDASHVEEAGFAIKETMAANIQKEMEELLHFSKISMTIPFNLPARLIPPFPQNEARLLPDIPFRLIGNKIIDISPNRPISSKLVISVTPPVAVNEVKECPSVAASERSKIIEKSPIADGETIEGCTSSGIRYTIRADKSSGNSSRLSSSDERHIRKRKRSESPQSYRSENRERRGRISQMYERDYGRYDKDYDRRDSGRYEKDYGRSDDKYGRDYDRDKRDKYYDRYDRDYGRSSRVDDRYDKDYGSRADDKYERDYGRSSRTVDNYERDYGRSSRADDKYDRDYDRYDRGSSRCSSTMSIKRRRQDSYDTPKRSPRTTPEHTPKPCDNPVNISSELEAEPITDDENNISPSSSSASNISKSLLLTNISDYVYSKSAEVTIENMPRRLADLFKHVLLPEQIQRPLAFPTEQENLKELIQWLDSKKLKLSTDKKKLLERLILKHFIQYCRSEQEHLLICGASEDYLDYRVYPVEIVKEIYHNVKEGEAAFNELRQLRNAEQKMTKAKTSSAVGFAKLLFGSAKELEKVFDFEQQELSCVGNRAKKENSIKFSNEYLNHLRELRTHLEDYCSSVGIMESKQTAVKEFLNDWKEMLNEQIKINEKRKECYADAKQKLSASIEEKRKKLAELKEQSQKLADSRIASTIKAHENKISLSKVKIRYNQLLDRVGKAASSGDQIDQISEHLFKHYKELLSCPTCKVNPKNCALTKCYHLFCEECITKMFKTRNRKCPECNTRVGPNDYHRVYF